MTPGTTVPAALVGVWEGAQVVHRPGLDYFEGRTGLMLSPCEGGWTVWFATDERWPQTLVTASVPSLHLDLTYRLTRLEVMARLGERIDLPQIPIWWRCFVVGGRAKWRLGGGRDNGRSWTWDVPALADLDPTDDTRLPDGTRVVDVRALAIVCQHVFGGAA